MSWSNPLSSGCLYFFLDLSRGHSFSSQWPSSNTVDFPKFLILFAPFYHCCFCNNASLQWTEERTRSLPTSQFLSTDREDSSVPGYTLNHCSPPPSLAPFYHCCFCNNASLQWTEERTRSLPTSQFLSTDREDSSVPGYTLNHCSPPPSLAPYFSVPLELSFTLFPNKLNGFSSKDLLLFVGLFEFCCCCFLIGYVSQTSPCMLGRGGHLATFLKFYSWSSEMRTPFPVMNSPKDIV